MTDIVDKAKQYQDYAIIKSQAHYDASVREANTGKWLGAAVIVSTAFVGTSIFANAAQNNPTFTIILGLISFLAAVLSGLQTFFKFSENAELHKTAAAGYERLRAQLDLFLLRYATMDESKREAAMAEFEKIAGQLDDLQSKSPTIPDKIYDAAKKKKETHPEPKA